MVSNATLSAKLREGRGKGLTRKLRASGRVPAIIYGHGEETRELSVDAKELERLFAHIHRENTIINLQIDGLKGDVKALVREVQSHPYRKEVLHVDFYQIHAGEKLTLQVPVILKGTPPGIKAGGMLQQSIDEIEIRCLPDAIPEHLIADVSGLEIGDSLHVSDLIAPEGVEFLVEAERTICSLQPPLVGGTEAAAPAAPVTSEPEVIRRKKEDA